MRGRAEQKIIPEQEIAPVSGSVTLSGVAWPGRSGALAAPYSKARPMTDARAFCGIRFPPEIIL
jgi:hypothetical protein